MSDTYKEAAKARGRARSAGVTERVREAMKSIMDEMKANAGVYPANGGAVSMNEVARRASIHATTFHTDAQKELRAEVRAWVESLKKKDTVGRMRVRRAYAERAEDWKRKYVDLQNSHQKTELDLQQAESERDEVMRVVERLRQENATLLELVKANSDNKVAVLHPKKK